jgi:phage recombination protein Bet
MSNVATVDRPIGPSITAAMAERYSMAPAAFEQTLRATIIPKDCTKEQLAAFLVVAHEYGLNPILKEIYAFPAKGGGIQPVVSIDGWVKLMNSHPMMDGIEFDDHLDDKKQLTAISAKVHRKDRAHPIVVTEYMAECRRATDPWKQWPHRMLRHKALIQAARYAFGYSNIFDPDEAERMGADVSGMRDVSPPPAPPPAPRVIAATRDPDPEILGVE